jgi:signal transduction histidine kinase
MKSHSFARFLLLIQIAVLTTILAVAAAGALVVLNVQNHIISNLMAKYLVKSSAALIREDIMIGSYSLASDHLALILKSIPAERACFQLTEVATGNILIEKSTDSTCITGQANSMVADISFVDGDASSVQAPGYRLALDFSFGNSIANPIGTLVMALVLLLCAISVCGVYIVNKKLIEFFNSIETAFAGGGLPTKIENTLEIQNVREVKKQLHELEMKVQLQRVTEARANAAVELARQVAHDIRSPIAALNVFEKETAGLQEDKRLLVRSAINRIKDIANSLLNKQFTHAAQRDEKSGDNFDSILADVPQALLLSSLVEQIVTEKRLQNRSNLDVELNFNSSQGSYGIFVAVVAQDLKRILSNLLNNAYEAIEGPGHIDIKIYRESNEIRIVISDSGKGIPPEIIAQLGIQGKTVGKVGGFGIGLYHAKTTIERWAGRFTIESSVGRGTSVSIILPSANPPGWFVSRLEIRPNSSLIVLDDDSSIHQVWLSRGESAKLKNANIDMFHFSNPEQIKSWLERNSDQISNSIFLFDFELIGHNETGLDIIETFKIEKNAVLVSSRFEETQIIERCLRLGVRIIPKILADDVPISILEAPKLFDAILIDDDNLTHMSWAEAAKSAEKQFKGFLSPVEFFAVADKLDRESQIYVDVSLGHNISGLDVASEIHKLGFKQINIATGWEKDQLKHSSIINRVCGKDPPF